MHQSPHHMLSSGRDGVSSAATQMRQRSAHRILKHRAILVFSATALIAFITTACVSRFRPKKADPSERSQGYLHLDGVRVTGSTEAVRMRTIGAPMLEG